MTRSLKVEVTRISKHKDTIHVYPQQVLQTAQTLAQVRWNCEELRKTARFGQMTLPFMILRTVIKPFTLKNHNIMPVLLF